MHGTSRWQSCSPLHQQATGLKQANGQDAMDGAPDGRARSRARIFRSQVWLSAHLGLGRARAPPQWHRRSAVGERLGVGELTSRGAGVPSGTPTSRTKGDKGYMSSWSRRQLLLRPRISALLKFEGRDHLE